MKFEPARLRRGELIAAAAAVVLVVVLFALPWFGLSVPAGVPGVRFSVSVNGWQSMSVLRWLILITALDALALAYVQATRRAPALPASLSVIATVLGAVCSVCVLYRVLLNPPGPALVGARAGGYIGLLSVLALTAGALWSLREEDPPDPVRNAAIEVVPVR